MDREAWVSTLSAGRLPCGRDDLPIGHSIDGIHIVVRCQCGCLFRSTDATIALGMAQKHLRTSEPTPGLGSAPCSADSLAPIVSRTDDLGLSTSVGPD